MVKKNNKTAIKKKILEILFKIKKKKVKNLESFDSLDLITLCVHLDKKLKISIDPNVINKITISDLIEKISIKQAND